MKIRNLCFCILSLITILFFQNCNTNFQSSFTQSSANNFLNFDSKEITKLYGPGIFIIDTLWDTNIGGPGDFELSQRFRATESGTIESIRPYWIASDGGYSSGDGGIIEINVYPDDETLLHAPDYTKKPIAYALYYPLLIDGKHSDSSYSASEVKLNSTNPIEKGKLYHVVYRNISSNPADNFIGINSSAVLKSTGNSSRWVNPVDWGCLRKQKNQTFWEDLSINSKLAANFAPVLQINLTNGKIIGSTVRESGNVLSNERDGHNRVWRLKAEGVRVREVFNPIRKKAVRAFSINTAAEKPGNLLWAIKINNVIKQSGRIYTEHTNFKIETAFEGDYKFGVYKWYDILLPKIINVEANSRVELEFWVEDSSTWIFAGQDGGANTYDHPAAFIESSAEVYLEETWVAARHEYHVRKDQPGWSYNWRTVLHLDD